MMSEIPSAVRAQVDSELDRIEAEDEVRAVFACESGSRAWGFASTDSDFDVRFIYVHRPDWYLSVDIERRRDVIERPISDDLDICGWDLKKSLGLYYKSNPPLLEWLGSPIVYREAGSTAQRLRDLLPTYYSPIACRYHYLHMARSNFRQYLRGPEVLRKKYLYVLRPIVAILWIERDLGPVPTRFQKALDQVIDDPGQRAAIDRLLTDKAAGKEMDYGPRVPEISDFLAHHLQRLEECLDLAKAPERSWGALNELFRGTLSEVWPAG